MAKCNISIKETWGFFEYWFTSNDRVGHFSSII